MSRIAIPAHRIAVCAETQSRWIRLLQQYGIVYLYAMSGYGKTVQAVMFAKEHFSSYLLVSVTEINWAEQVEAYLKEKHNGKRRMLLVLDDLQQLRSEQDKQALFDLLLSQSRSSRAVQILLLSRAALPDYLIPLQLTKQLICEGRFSLCLNLSQIRELLDDIAPDAMPQETRMRIAQDCLQVSDGYGIAVSAYLQRSIDAPQDAETARRLTRNDVYSYLDSHMYSMLPKSYQNALTALSIYDTFESVQAQELLGEQADAMLRDFLRIGSFLTFAAPDTYIIHPFFRMYLGEKLQARPFAEQEAIYLRAAEGCEKRRDYAKALRFYQLTEREDRLDALIIFLSENADGCAFAEMCDAYLPPRSDKQESARLLGARAMLAAYGMRVEEHEECMEQLKTLSEQEQAVGITGEAAMVYMRTQAANPLGNAEQLRIQLERVVQDPSPSARALRNILPTGNLPSLINGGMDLLPWEKRKKQLYAPVKAMAETVLGEEAVGIADAAMGELLYEQNARIDAMAYLTRALSDVNFGGSIRVQYAATAIMARLFQAEGQAATARSILLKTREQVIQKRFTELLPNLAASLLQDTLLSGDSDAICTWLKDSGVDEHAPFFITNRFLLMQKARAYTALGRTMEALHCLDVMEQYVTVYSRTYQRIEMTILKAILLNRRGEPWLETLEEAARAASEYKLIRILADQGAALHPLWKELLKCKPPGLSSAYLATVDKELHHMAALYPNYLSTPKPYDSLTDKETAVLQLMAEGLNNTEISQTLGVNIGTAKFHVGNILRKLKADNRTVAVKIAQAEGML